MKLVLIAVFGAFGALARFGIANAVGHRSFPYATLVTNVIGSFALGFVLTVATQRMRPELSSAIAVGFLGAFTTFSTLSWDAFAFAKNGRPGMALLNIVISCALGVGAAGLGYLSADRLVLGAPAVTAEHFDEFDEGRLDQAFRLEQNGLTQEPPARPDMTD